MKRFVMDFLVLSACLCPFTVYGGEPEPQPCTDCPTAKVEKADCPVAAPTVVDQVEASIERLPVKDQGTVAKIKAVLRSGTARDIEGLWESIKQIENQEAQQFWSEVAEMASIATKERWCVMRGVTTVFYWEKWKDDDDARLRSYHMEMARSYLHFSPEFGEKFHCADDPHKRDDG